MKKFIVSFVTILLFCAFKPATTIQHYTANLGYTCSEMPVAVSAMSGSWDGIDFNYEINYCSSSFSSKERYVKFTLMFIDKEGNILKETSTGPVLNNEKSKLSDVHIAGTGLSQEPYDCLISWFYKDVNADYETITQPDGTVVKSRSTAKDEWKIINTRSLKLFKNKTK